MSNLPAQVTNFISGARKNRQPASTGDSAFLKFSGKTGEYVLGRDEIDVDGEIAIINTLSLSHGYVRWGEKPPAKVFVSISQELPTPPAPFEGVDENGRPKTYMPTDARHLTGRFIDDNLGDFSFECNSMGGVERVDELYDAILDRAEAGTEYIFPMVKLANDFYKRETGKVYKPIFDIVGWANKDGEEEGKKAEPKKVEAPEPEPEPPTRRRRRRA